MAKVATDVRQHIDYLLDHLFSAWVDLPRVVREIHSWDLVDQLSYIEEWGAQDSLWGCAAEVSVSRPDDGGTASALRGAGAAHP